MKAIGLPVLFTALLLSAAAIAPAASEMQPMLDQAGLLARVVGNTIYYHSPSEDVYEFLAQDGSIHGQSSVHGRYTARWRFYQRDSICFQHEDPMASGCVAVVLRGLRIEYHRRDGVVEGPFDMLPGNPHKL